MCPVHLHLDCRLHWSALLLCAAVTFQTGHMLNRLGKAIRVSPGFGSCRDRAHLDLEHTLTGAIPGGQWLTGAEQVVDLLRAASNAFDVILTTVGVLK
jgi:hypothetical protein